MADPAKQNSSTKPTRSAGPASWATKNSGLPCRTSKSGCATAMHQRLAMCSAARRPDTFIVLGVCGETQRRTETGSQWSVAVASRCGRSAARIGDTTVESFRSSQRSHAAQVGPRRLAD